MPFRMGKGPSKLAGQRIHLRHVIYKHNSKLGLVPFKDHQKGIPTKHKDMAAHSALRCGQVSVNLQTKNPMPQAATTLNVNHPRLRLLVKTCWDSASAKPSSKIPITWPYEQEAHTHLLFDLKFKRLRMVRPFWHSR